MILFFKEKYSVLKFRMRCLYLLAFVLVGCAVFGSEARNRGVFQNEFQALSLKQLLHFLARSELGNVRVTTPLTNEKIQSLLERIPQIGE
jgi:hypothetical protein